MNLTDPTEKLILARPPVAEAIIAVQFVDLPWWTALHHGLYYDRIEQSYPNYTQTQEIPPTVETFPPIPKIARFHFSSEIDAGCANFRSPDDAFLLRVQRNRFAYHWVKSPDGKYPHFDSNIIAFQREYERFASYCTNNGSEIQPVLVEVVYVNKIAPVDGESYAQLMHSVFELDIGDFELASLNRTYADSGVGRLYTEINVDPRENVITFQLTSRRIVQSAGDTSESLTTAHNFLIDKFQALTTKAARETRWGQQ